MKVDILQEGLQITPEVQKVIDRKIEKLEKRLKRYHPETSHLRIHISKNEKKDLYECLLELRVLHKLLAVKKSARDPVEAFDEAYEALIKEFEKYRLKVNKSLRSKKATTRKVFFEALPEHVEDWKSLFNEALKQKIKSLYRIARHELLHYQLTGTLEPGEIIPADVVDEAILRVYERFSREKTQRDIEHELVREVIVVVREFAKDVERTRTHRISIDVSADTLPEPEEVSTLGEEILYFYEPDEALKLEDLIEDPTALTPEQVVESEELQHLLYQHLSELPEDQRTAFTLVNIEGYGLEEASLVLQKPVKEIQKLVEKAEEELSMKLAVDEVPMAIEKVREMYRSIKKIPLEISVEERILRAKILVGEEEGELT